MAETNVDLPAEPNRIMGAETTADAVTSPAQRAEAARRARQRLADAIAGSGETPEELYRIMREEAWRNDLVLGHGKPPIPHSEARRALLYAAGES